MELIEKGMDFDAIILKAKTNYPENQYSSTQDMNSNYNLQHDNEGGFLGIGQEKEIFKRFDD